MLAFDNQQRRWNVLVTDVFGKKSEKLHIILYCIVNYKEYLQFGICFDKLPLLVVDLMTIDKAQYSF
uniref:Zinc finger CCCH domain-containing protein 44 isoform X3 n=1 Tax=Rhizophora mucronata TaxID=61149 RepID=A0A2P2KTV8_RHIMU